MKVKCIKDAVDGLTLGKEYVVTDIFIRVSGIFYGMIDDYGTYDEYRAERFVHLDGGLDTLIKWNGLSVSIKLV
jgi:hypothetical protein